jgi:lysophospholipase L1-like esterase
VAQQKFLAFGDSITNGETGETNPNEQGYPTRLEKMLRDGGLPGAVVENYGVGGEPTSGGLTRIDSVLAEGGDFILIMEGTNDIRIGDVSIETTAFNLARMVDKSQAAGVTPILASIIPIRPGFLTNLDAELAVLLRQEALSENIDFQDTYAVFTRYPNAWPDLYNLEVRKDVVGHPNGDGYRVIARSWADVILGIDTLAPVVGEVQPKSGSKNVSSGATVVVEIFDHGSGIDTEQTRLIVNGSPVTAQRSGTAEKSTYRYTPSGGFSGVVTVEVDAADQAGNRYASQVTQFSIEGTTFLTGDVNFDGRVDGHDLVAFAFSFGKDTSNARYRAVNDFNKYGEVDGDDLSILASNFGKSSV